ncbi:MAG: hypothetical protein AABW79_03800 [Nanoarchaeota archaeon]
MGLFSFLKRDVKYESVSPERPYFVVNDGIAVTMRAFEDYDYVKVEGNLGNSASFRYSDFIIHRHRAGYDIILDLSEGKEHDTSTAATAINICCNMLKRKVFRKRFFGRNHPKMIIVGNETLYHIFDIADLFRLESRIAMCLSVDEAKEKLGVKKEKLEEIIERDVKTG